MMYITVDTRPDLEWPRCYLLDGISKGAWLNRSSIIFAGNDKWSVDPRVSIVSNMGDKHEYSLQIQKVDVTDEGFYTCSIQSERNPRPKLIQLIVKDAQTGVNTPEALQIHGAVKVSKNNKKSFRRLSNA
ncbi:neuronal growth regulator 1 isoform X2 [Clarias magur]|uniref:Neuronal growth regulator 1 isoform X2 n=1 Tax=Clarias magur TaxID=1594786 RepID=A0A8J4XBZ0_CLAMG|nr:neuronal growth regulator 1 isoform X2 [Clarias magur]